MCSSITSDSLVEEAAGGESAAKSLRETDKNGFHESEVIVFDIFVVFSRHTLNRSSLVITPSKQSICG